MDSVECSETNPESYTLESAVFVILDGSTMVDTPLSELGIALQVSLIRPRRAP